MATISSSTTGRPAFLRASQDDVASQAMAANRRAGREEGVSDSLERLVVTLQRFRYLGKDDTGFLIAAGEARSNTGKPLLANAPPPPGLSPAWLKEYNPSRVVIKGVSPSLATQDAIGATVELGGEWVMDPKHRLQFQFQWAREVMPTSVEALKAYLAAGRLKGIGEQTAEKILNTFGLQTFDILDNHPKKLVEIPGITPAKAEKIAEQWQEKRNNYRLTAFFGLHGIGEVWISRITDRLGSDAVESRVRNNPYLLTMVDGIGFSTADRMALDLGISTTDPKRIRALLLHLLNQFREQNGHTLCPTQIWFRDAARELGLSANTLAPHAQDLINRKAVVLRQAPVNMGALTDGDVPWNGERVPCVSLRRDALCERKIANHLNRLTLTSEGTSPEVEIVSTRMLAERANFLDASQIEAVRGLIRHPVSVLTGGPGTGKTTTLKTVLDIADKVGWSTLLAAPTGRAAKRMQEAVGRPAGTIHRTLYYSPRSGFGANLETPLKADLFVVDETSMVDNELAAHWLDAVPDGARVLFVGDVDQLPSVGPGAFLHDLITSGAAHVARLTKIHRTADGSKIATAAAQVVQGRLPERGGDPWSEDFSWWVPDIGIDNEAINESMAEEIMRLVQGCIDKGVPRDDIQILTPQRKGIVGVEELNERVRWLLNARGPAARHDLNEDSPSPFVVGDRLLVNKNDYDNNIFNGDMGVVDSISPEDGEMVLKMENGEKVTLQGQQQRSLTLGSVTTVHKSQGGERPVVLVAVSPSHGFSTSRNLLYTAITRGQNKVILLAPPRTLSQCLRRVDRTYRATGLVDEIQRLMNLKAQPRHGAVKP